MEKEKATPLDDIKAMFRYHKEQGWQVNKKIYITKESLQFALKHEKCTTKEELEHKLRTSNIYPRDVKFIIVDQNGRSTCW